MAPKDYDNSNPPGRGEGRTELTVGEQAYLLGKKAFYGPIETASSIYKGVRRELDGNEEPLKERDRNLLEPDD